MTTTRRRGSALEDAILRAGWEQLVEAGYPGLTYEAVAERARTGKAALYRRWPDKETLLLAVLEHAHLETRPDVPDTGSLRGDMLAALRAANRLGDMVAPVLSTLLGAHFDEITITPAQLRAQILGDRALTMRQLVQRAVDRGELAAMPPARVVTLAFDLFRHELFMRLGRVPDEVILDIVDTVFLPFVTQER